MVATIDDIKKYSSCSDMDFISQYAPIWMFVVYMRGKAKASKICGRPLFWSIPIYNVSNFGCLCNIMEVII